MCSTRTTMLSVCRCQPSRSVAPMAIAGGCHRGWCTQTECMTLGVCGETRCSGIDSRTEGVVDVLGAMVERITCSTRTMMLLVRRCQPSRWLHRWPSQAALTVGGAHELSA